MPRRTTLLLAPSLSLMLFLPGLSFAQSSSSGYPAAPNQPADLTTRSVTASDIATPEALQANDVQSNLQSAYSQVRIVRLSYVEGDVRIDRGGNEGFIKAFANMPVVEGARLWTQGDGRAEAEFEDGSTIRITPDTMLDFNQLRLGGKGERLSTVALERGEAYFKIKKHGGDEFALSLNPLQEQLVAKKESHFRVAVDGEGVKIADFKGSLELIKPDGQHVEIGKNESLSLDFNDAQRYFLARGTISEPLDSWDKERDQQATLTATSQSLGYNAAYSTSMYSYGLQDLSQYGSYINAPGFGYMWRPYYESAAWDPFQNGQWIWYPRYNNYIFVSSYPWGWRPYHYGSWVNVPRVGWCWNPRGATNFAPLPSVVNAPPGFRLIRPPRASPVDIITVGNTAGLTHAGTRGGSAMPTGNAIVGTPGNPAMIDTSRSMTTPVGDVARFGRGARDRVAQQGTIQQSSVPAVVVPVTRPIQTPNAIINAGRSERLQRIESVRPLTAPIQAPHVERMQPMNSPSPYMSAPQAIPLHSASTGGNGGRGHRDR